MTPGRWLAPLGASAAVLAVFVVPGLITPRSSSDAGPGPDGLITPNGPVTPSLPPNRAEDRRRARAVDVTGYTPSGRTLRVYYTVDQSLDCSALIDPPQVTERADSVVVRLARRVSQAPDEVCASLLLTNSVDITLSRPLGGRTVLDRSRGGALVPLEVPYRPGSGLPTPPDSRAGR